MFASRVYPLHTLPAVGIYTITENNTDELNGSPGIQKRYSRRLDVVVECYTEAVDDVDNVLDSLAVDVEAAMAGDITLGGLAVDTELTSTNITISGEGDTPLASGRLFYRVWYRTTSANPETSI